MGWRQVMGNFNSTSYPQYSYNPQYSGLEDIITDITHFTDKDTDSKCDFDTETDKAISKLNQVWKGRGLTMESIPIEQRQSALVLDADMTTAANVGDVTRFRDALSQWKRCWLPLGGVAEESFSKG